MNLKIVRPPLEKCRKHTEGELFIDGKHEAWTLEDPCIDWKKEKKVYGQTAIPPGRYAIEITYSNRFKRRMIQVMDVKTHEGIRIHAGNKVADTHGCPLVGDKRTSPDDGYIAESRKAEARLFAKVDTALQNDEEVWLTVEHAR